MASAALALSIGAFSVLASLLSCAIYARLLRAAIIRDTMAAINSQLDPIRKEFSDAIKEGHGALAELRSWNSRVLATTRHARTAIQAPEPDADEPADLPSWAVALAKGAGVDVDKLMAGDETEIGKAKGLLGGAQQQEAITHLYL